jgi:uncharacterized protein (DUF2236 family)
MAWPRTSARIVLRLLWVLAAAPWSRPAPACEICVEDHIAATYDHGVIARAEASGQNVLFVAVRGKDVAAPRSEAAIRGALAAVAGVDRASVRYSVFPAAASFAWNPKRISSADVLRAVNGGLDGSGLSLVPLKVIR